MIWYAIMNDVGDVGVIFWVLNHVFTLESCEGFFDDVSRFPTDLMHPNQKKVPSEDGRTFFSGSIWMNTGMDLMEENLRGNQVLFPFNRIVFHGCLKFLSHKFT